MDENQVIWNEKVAGKIIKKLEKRRMEGSYAATASQAEDEVIATLTPGASVFRCGTMTATYAGLWESIAKLPEIELIDPYEPGIPPEESLARRQKGMAADFMIASSNAITLDGKLVNLDGMGNRVAAMAFGPKKVILMVGMKKVTPDLESAMARVKHYAAPVNNIRYGFENSCVENGLCIDCKSPTRICNMWSIIEGHMIEKRIHVKLIGEFVGYWLDLPYTISAISPKLPLPPAIIVCISIFWLTRYPWNIKDVSVVSPDRKSLQEASGYHRCFQDKAGLSKIKFIHICLTS